MNVLLVPTLGLDISLLDRLANSIDFPIKHKIIINNGKQHNLDKWSKLHPDWVVLDQIYNLGVAASWNMAPKLFPDEDGWLICNDDIWFESGVLEKMNRCYNSHVKDVHFIRTGLSSFYCFVWTRKSIEDFGLFDENFWPAYHEDSDMQLRYSLGNFKEILPLGIEEAWDSAKKSDGGCRVRHGKLRSGGYNYQGMIQGCSLFLRWYFWKKWGSNKTLCNYKTPYNLEVPISYWEFDFNLRKKIVPIFDCFMDNPKVSLYQDEGNAWGYGDK